MPRIASLATAVPSNEVPQARAKEVATQVYKGIPELESLLRVFDRTGVETRYLVHPAEWYLEERSFDERSAEYCERALELGEKVVRECLGRAQIQPGQVDHIFFVTTTGLTTPSIDALLAHRLGFKQEIKRSPLFGLGCAGGTAALMRAHEYCKAFPKHRVLVLSIEICSLIFSTQATTPTDLIGVTLFGDGAAAALVVGDETVHPGARILFTKSVLFPESEELMGWEFTSDGMRLVLAPEIPEIVRTQVKEAVERFLLETAQPGGRVRHYLLHPGGPKILDAYREAFGIEEGALRPIRESLKRYGNLSSAAVLFLLEELIASGRARTGEKGLMVALGPGFAAEMLLLGW